MTGSLTLIDFRLFPDGHQLPDTFVVGGTKFENLDASGALVVNDTAGERGLQFRSKGLRMLLPPAAEAVLVTAGGFAGTVDLYAKDRNGQVLFFQTLQPANAYVRTLVQASGLSVIELLRGGNEGILLELVVPC